MIKSTATAGPVHLDTSPSAFFLWEFPEKPVSVRLSLEVVERLEKEVLQSFRAITARGSEVGGLLLGRAESAGSYKTVIADYELIPCDYTRGPLYLLSDEEKASVEEAMRRKKGQANSVVGFFRSNTRKDLALDEEDLAIFRQYCARPEQVFLLVKPFAAKASVGGVFIWENGKVRTEASYIEFPFRRAELMKGEFAKSIVLDAGAKEAPAESNGSSPAAAPHKAGVRAAVLPFSLRRDEEPPVAAAPLKREERAAVVTLPSKPSEPPPAVPAAKQVANPFAAGERKAPEGPAPPLPPIRRKEPVETPAARKQEQTAPALPPLREEKKREEKKTAVAAEKPEKKAVAAEAAAPDAETLPARRVFSGRKLWALFGGLVMLALAGGSAFYLKTHSQVPSVAAVREAAPLQLKAEQRGDRLLVSWNKDAELVKLAQRAVLSISDGPQKEDVQLDPNQLHFGSIEYTPVTGDVSFRLEVADAKLGKSRSEYIRVLKPEWPAPDAAADTKPAPTGNQAVLVPQAQPQTQPKNAPPVTAGQTSATPPAVEQAQPAPVATPQPPPRQFSLAARVRPPDPADLPEAPRVEAANPGGTTALRPIVPTAVPAPPPPEVKSAPAQPAAQTVKPPVQTPVSPGAQPQPVRVGGNVVEPKLVRRVDAIYPPMARQARVGGTVRMQASIGKDGKIKKVQVLTGHPLLRQAAVDAVGKWVYNPSMLNGAPVESTTEIELIFNLANAR